MNNEPISMEQQAQEMEVLKRMIGTLRMDAANAMTAASEFKARYEMAAQENAQLRAQLAAAEKKQAAAAGPVPAKAVN